MTHTGTIQQKPRSKIPNDNNILIPYLGPNPRTDDHLAIADAAARVGMET